ncbi:MULTISPECIES: lytic transglycosylase domain-containing protein [unclassified Cupriavidus]|uniref:lytic transglycosylase domain-containing protein n=1 Tax=unclassified Cupriavidus TaxID=2640874 RepID=UPI001C00825F|nr:MULTISPECIES: lytic transglycosylase domain-containing protein [unclassified Cupriavidus]MCA3182545.1 transglycosylase SLT domain-containing protein [Cupriavidus sp.]MCA3192808.1 transglycosylase SLT domain-containing protein [Cupriavidus sp.]MCA3195009.1 transglycosylase SLT domain-containing protein [Cupriavidus sp.]MCA3203979.1 transglycosylase SLT domain-containing protein [Cupriavidus sp.]MCA3205738.1 transglycosylase SLT domain-containing protein [Cupriavidus sp.]
MSGWKTLHLPGIGRALQVRLRQPVPGVSRALQVRLAHPVAGRALLRGGRTTLKYTLNSLGVLSVAAAVTLTVSQQWRTSLAGALAGNEAPAVLVDAAVANAEAADTVHAVASTSVPALSADAAAARLLATASVKGKGLPTVSGVDEWSQTPAGKVPSVAHLAAQIPVQRVALEARNTSALGSAREQAAVAEYIARKYRVASQATAQLVKAAYMTGREVGIDPLLILGVIAIESSFNPYAESGVGAQGLMQVMTKVHQDKYEAVGGVTAALNPYANIKIGALVLKDCIARAGTIEGGLKYYVGATTNTDGGYGAKVLAERGRLRALLGLPAVEKAGDGKTQAEHHQNGEKLEASGNTAQAA